MQRRLMKFNADFVNDDLSDILTLNAYCIPMVIYNVHFDIKYL